MNIYHSIKRNISQIYAITKLNVKLKLRFKLNLVFSFITPILSIVMPIILLNRFFDFNNYFGPWNATNFLLYQFLAYDIMILMDIIVRFPGNFNTEKYWQTLEALIIAPFNRFNLLLGLFFAHLISIAIPFTFFLVIAYIYLPISILSLLFVLLVFFLIALFFSGIGIIIGVLVISRENLVNIVKFSVTLILWLSCISYPLQIYPVALQEIISLNPFFYIFDALRWTWLENNILVSIMTHTRSYIILFLCVAFIPLTGVILFNVIYKRYGIVGY